MNSIILPLLILGLSFYFNTKEECKPAYYWEHEEDNVIIHYHKCGKLDDEFKEKVLNHLQPYIVKEYGTEIEIKFKQYYE